MLQYKLYSTEEIKKRKVDQCIIDYYTYEDEYEPDTWWNDYRNYLFEITDGKVTGEWYDNGEPEDNIFTRDWDWVQEKLEELAERINEYEQRLSNSATQ